MPGTLYHAVHWYCESTRGRGRSTHRIRIKVLWIYVLQAATTTQILNPKPFTLETFSLFTSFWKITRIEDWNCVLLIDHAMSTLLLAITGSKS